jgi:hypothetical protein
MTARSPPLAARRCAGTASASSAPTAPKLALATRKRSSGDGVPRPASLAAPTSWSNHGPNSGSSSKSLAAKSVRPSREAAAWDRTTRPSDRSGSGRPGLTVPHVGDPPSSVHGSSAAPPTHAHVTSPPHAAAAASARSRRMTAVAGERARVEEGRPSTGGDPASSRSSATIAGHGDVVSHASTPGGSSPASAAAVTASSSTRTATSSPARPSHAARRAELHTSCSRPSSPDPAPPPPPPSPSMAPRTSTAPTTSATAPTSAARRFTPPPRAWWRCGGTP